MATRMACLGARSMRDGAKRTTSQRCQVHRSNLGEREIGRRRLSWLKVLREGNERYRQFLVETPSRQSDFRDKL